MPVFLAITTFIDALGQTGLDDAPEQVQSIQLRQTLDSRHARPVPHRLRRKPNCIPGTGGRKQAHEFHDPNDDWLWAAGLWEENPELGACYTMVVEQAVGDWVLLRDAARTLMKATVLIRSREAININ